MANPPNLSLFHQRFLTGNKPLLRLDDEFLRKHTKVVLRSDVSNRDWKVNLDGDNRLAGGWEEFAAVHKFKDGDVLVFRHYGDEIFHVSVSDTDVICLDDEEVNVLVKKNKKGEAETSSEHHSCILKARVTPYSLNNDRLDLSKDFKFVSFDKYKKKKLCEIDLVNEKGQKWSLILSRNRTSGVFYIRGGWVKFCYDNKLRQGDLCKFKLFENGEKPVLRLCPHESNNVHQEDDEEQECPPEADVLKAFSKGKEKKTLSPFLKVKLTQSRFNTGKLYISSVFMAEHGIKKSGEMILMNEDGRKWLSYLQKTGQSRSEWFYLRNGWKEMCEANGVKVNDSFVLELIKEDAKLMFKFCSKIENQENNGKVNRRTRKKRACETPLQERSPQVSNKPNTYSRKLRCKEPRSCSVSDQVANVKRCILETLDTVRQFRAELETKEKDLEASLVEIDGLGEMLLGISQIFQQ